MQNWEYRVTEFEEKLHDLQSFLNQQGEDGWEFVSLLPPGSITSKSQTVQEALSNIPAHLQLIFKRQHV